MIQRCVDHPLKVDWLGPVAIDAGTRPSQRRIGGQLAAIAQPGGVLRGKGVGGHGSRDRLPDALELLLPKQLSGAKVEDGKDGHHVHPVAVCPGEKKDG